MSEDAGASAPETTTDTQDGDGAQAADWTPPASQAELDRIISDRLARQRAQFADYGDLKAKAAKFDEIEEANKTEIQRATEARQAAEQAAAAATRDLARYKVAAAKGVPAELLVGDDEESIAAYADQLIAFRGNQPAPSFDGGARTPAPTGQDMNALIRQRARVG